MSLVDKLHLLIKQIQSNPCLYDKSHKHFKDAEFKENVWVTISTIIRMPVEDCKRNWTNLRNKYGRELKSMSSGTVSTSHGRQWEFFSPMSFLNVHIRQRKSHCYLDDAPHLSDSSSLTESIDPENDDINCPKTTHNFPKIEEISVEQLDKNIVLTQGEGDNKDLATEIEDTLGGGEKADIVVKTVDVNSFFSSNFEKRHASSNSKFGEYVAAKLTEMEPKEQALKKIKIMQVLEEDFLT